MNAADLYALNQTGSRIVDIDPNRPHDPVAAAASFLRSQGCVIKQRACRFTVMHGDDVLSVGPSSLVRLAQEARKAIERRKKAVPE